MDISPSSQHEILTDIVLRKKQFSLLPVLMKFNSFRNPFDLLHNNTVSFTAFRFFFVITALALLPEVSAVSPTLEVGIASVEVSGVRPYAAKQNLSKNETGHVTVPTVRLGYPVTRNFSLGLSYCRYTDLKSSGCAGTPNIFNEDGGVWVEVVTPVRGSEDIREFALDGRYHFTISEKIGFDAGLVLSQFHSKAEIGEVLGVVALSGQSIYRKRGEFEANDLRLGGTAAIRYALTKSWRLTAGYRYAAPPERKLHLYSVALGYCF